MTSVLHFTVGTMLAISQKTFMLLKGAQEVAACVEVFWGGMKSQHAF